MIVLNSTTFHFERKIPYQIAARNTLTGTCGPGAVMARPSVQHLIMASKHRLIVAYSDATLHVLDVRANQVKQ